LNWQKGKEMMNIEGGSEARYSLFLFLPVQAGIGVQSGGFPAAHCLKIIVARGCGSQFFRLNFGRLGGRAEKGLGFRPLSFRAYPCTQCFAEESGPCIALHG
jgi:hypothetical protein